MDSTFGDVETVAMECAKNTSIDYEKIQTCTNSRQGNQLQHAYAVQTNKTKPADAFVPWVTLNGNHTDEIQDKAQTDLIGLICETYKVDFSSGICSFKLLFFLGSKSARSMQENNSKRLIFF